MAALSQAVVIVEGGRRSGARLTADFALDLGREVLAVPGEAGRRFTAAPHALLRQGASLCESAADVVDVIPVRPEAPHPATDATHAADTGHTLGDEKCRLLGALGDGPMPIDRLAERLGLSVSSAAAAVSELEVDGLVRLLPGGTYRLASRD
jgi:DNA processing protein